MLGEVYLLNLYPGSHRHEDDAVRLGRVTTWIDAGSGISRGAGQKLFVAGEELRTLLEIGEIQFVSEVDGNTSGESLREESP
jgi:type VI secretion system protein ImpE